MRVQSTYASASSSLELPEPPLEHERKVVWREVCRTCAIVYYHGQHCEHGRVENEKAFGAFQKSQELFEERQAQFQEAKQEYDLTWYRLTAQEKHFRWARDVADRKQDVQFRDQLQNAIQLARDNRLGEDCDLTNLLMVHKLTPVEGEDFGYYTNADFKQLANGDGDGTLIGDDCKPICNDVANVCQQ